MLRESGYGWMTLIALLALGVYLIKYDVQAIHSHNQLLERQIATEREALQMLRAEWVYLNRTERLEKLAADYTKLVPMKPERIASWADAPTRNKRIAQFDEVH